MAKYKVEITEKARKNARERVSPQENVADPLSRKHLAGLRVVQKNLVYVSGLSPLEEGDDLLSLLRGEKYFGQYGKIIKIVVSKAKDRTGMGIYVTFARKEDAETCIAALDGSLNGDRVIRYFERSFYFFLTKLTHFTELNTVRLNTAQRTYAVRLAVIAIACFFMSLRKRTRASRVQISHL